MATAARWELLRTTIGLKAAMAISGAVLSGWAVLHMFGNLLVFAGPEIINGYGAALHGGPVVWMQRVVLVSALGVHVTGAALLIRRSRRARRERYRHRLAAQTSTVASRTMPWGGLAIGLFLAYHVAHIYGAGHTSYVAGDVHHNVVAGLADPLAGTLYALSTLAFGLHIHHGTWSLFRSLGHTEPFARGVRRATAGLAGALTVGFLAPVFAAGFGLLG